MVEKVRRASKEKVEIKIKYVPTVRVIIEDPRGMILLLKKSPKSRAPNLWEFPGGQIDKGDIDRGNPFVLSEQAMHAGIRETFEETGIDLSFTTLALLHEFSYSFKGKGDSKFQYRKVHLLHVKLDNTPEVKIRKMRDHTGKSVDKHDEYDWVTKEDLDQKKQMELLSGNSSEYEAILH